MHKIHPDVAGLDPVPRQLQCRILKSCCVKNGGAHLLPAIQALGKVALSCAGFQRLARSKRGTKRTSGAISDVSELRCAALAIPCENASSTLSVQLSIVGNHAEAKLRHDAATRKEIQTQSQAKTTGQKLCCV